MVLLRSIGFQTVIMDHTNVVVPCGPRGRPSRLMPARTAWPFRRVLPRMIRQYRADPWAPTPQARVARETAAPSSTQEQPAPSAPARPSAHQSRAALRDPAEAADDRGAGTCCSFQNLRHQTGPEITPCAATCLDLMLRASPKRRTLRANQIGRNRAANSADFGSSRRMNARPVATSLIPCGRNVAASRRSCCLFARACHDRRI